MHTITLDGKEHTASDLTYITKIVADETHLKGKMDLPLDAGGVTSAEKFTLSISGLAYEVRTVRPIDIGHNADPEKVMRIEFESVGSIRKPE
jgi:hypothetical protein